MLVPNEIRPAPTVSKMNAPEGAGILLFMYHLLPGRLAK